MQAARIQSGVYWAERSGRRINMKSLNQALRYSFLAILGATLTVAPSWGQSPPPTPDPQKSTPPSEQTQQGQQKPIDQKDTVNPKNSKEDVDAIGNRSVGKGINFYSL